MAPIVGHHVDVEAEGLNGAREWHAKCTCGWKGPPQYQRHDKPGWLPARNRANIDARDHKNGEFMQGPKDDV